MKNHNQQTIPVVLQLSQDELYGLLNVLIDTVCENEEHPLAEVLHAVGEVVADLERAAERAEILALLIKLKGRDVEAMQVGAIVPKPVNGGATVEVAIEMFFEEHGWLVEDEGENLRCWALPNAKMLEHLLEKINSECATLVGTGV